MNQNMGYIALHSRCVEYFKGQYPSMNQTSTSTPLHKVNLDYLKGPLPNFSKLLDGAKGGTKYWGALNFSGIKCGGGGLPPL